jgi:hypothetical protein
MEINKSFISSKSCRSYNGKKMKCVCTRNGLNVPCKKTKRKKYCTKNGKRIKGPTKINFFSKFMDMF